MYKFFVTANQMKDNIVEIQGEDVNHIKNVLRLGLDEKIDICDLETSTNCLCKIIELDNKYIKCEIIDKLESKSEPKTYLHIFQGIPKAEKMETIIQKTTEIGASEITPVAMNRCVVKLEAKHIDKKILRWQKIAEVAAKQSKRDKIPLVNPPINIKNIYEKLEDYDIVLVAYESEENYNIKSALEEVKAKMLLKIAVIVGPEGGIEEKEIELLKSFGGKIITLGKRILRTETAPIVLSSIIMYEFDEMV
ncbi:MAG: 16S rRNA (uracil(1498)-N(3))-methyltransferase [Clostridia bacterium]|nr:16S rRNA (uracil(1498)-N(3))-methyltransferase [Clostridia bacterium]